MRIKSKRRYNQTTHGRALGWLAVNLVVHQYRDGFHLQNEVSLKDAVTSRFTFIT
jgi:hypothetical protein